MYDWRNFLCLVVGIVVARTIIRFRGTVTKRFMAEATVQNDSSPKPNVGRASTIMGLSLFLSRVLGILRDVIMGAQFGRNATTDAYTLAFMIPDLLFFLIAGGALSSAFIPVFSEYLHTDRRKEAWHIFSSVATIMSTALIALILLVFAFTPQLISAIIDHKQEANYGLIAQISRILLPAQYAFFIGGLMVGTLYAHQRFSIPGLGPNIYNLGIIFGAIVISHFVHPGIMGMAIGAVSGAFLGNLIIPFFAMRKLGGEIKVNFDFQHPGVKKVFVLMAPVIFGLSLPGVYAIIMRSLASRYPDGIITSIDFANKLMQAPLGIFGQSFAIAIFPALAQFYAQKRMDMFRSQVEKSIRTVLFITIPLAVFMAIAAPDISGVLYSWGKSKTASQEGIVVSLQLFCLGIPAWCLHPILMRGYFSLQQTLKPVIVGTVTTGVFVLLCSLLQASPLQWRGLSLASSLAAIMMCIYMLFSLSKDVGGLDLKSIAKGLDGTAIATLGLTIAALIPAFLVPTGNVLLSVLRLALIAGFGSVAFTVIARKQKLEEITVIDRAMNKVQKLLPK